MEELKTSAKGAYCVSSFTWSLIIGVFKTVSFVLTAAAVMSIVVGIIGGGPVGGAVGAFIWTIVQALGTNAAIAYVEALDEGAGVCIGNQPSCPHLYSWNGEKYDDNGDIFIGTHCPESEDYQELMVTQPVAVQGDTLTFKIVEIYGEISYINSVEMFYKYKGDNGSAWTELEMLSATHNNSGDVSEALNVNNDNDRVNTVYGDEILLTYSVPYGGVENAEFKCISSGYYLFTDDISCEVLEVVPELYINPGDTVTLKAKINNIHASALPADAVVYFNIQGSGYSGSKVASVSAEGLVSGSPKWFSCDWTVPVDCPAGSYSYDVSVFIGENDITCYDDTQEDEEPALSSPNKAVKSLCY